MPNKEKEIEGDVPGRKRISLACQRCRKRKIKCEPSGDAGDGQACVACQSAKSNTCQYLRVNSGEVHCPSPESSNGPWQFSLPVNEETSFSVVPAHDLSQYSINNLSQMALSTGRAPYRSTNHTDTFSRTSNLSYGASPQRPFQIMSQHNQAGSDFYAAYQTQNSLPYTNNAISPTAFAMQDVSPAWSSSSACGLTSTDTTLTQNTSLDYGTLQYQGSTYPGAEVPSVRAEESPYFPGLSPLATHLPAPANVSGRARCLPVPVQSAHSNNRGPSLISESSFSTVNSQYTPETDSDTWTSATLLSDHNSGSVASSGGTESNSSPIPREASIYEYTPSLASNSLGGGNMAGYSALSLPTINDPTDPQNRPTGSSLDAYTPTYARLPTLDPPFQDYHCPATSISAVTTTESRTSELTTPRGHRLLQPQPRRASYGRSSLSSSNIETVGIDGRKSASVRRQERQYAGRHQ